MGKTVSLASSDGQFAVTVAGDDVELVLSVLLLLEVSGSKEVTDARESRVVRA
ncbi:MAG TPA: hypothetical protein VFX21_14790 [Acidimicrobiia bacterium]|nr:hypothetical protein [Acidimicrobiia bacterium]